MVLKIPRSLQPLDRIPFLFKIKLRLDDLEFQCILLLVRQSVVVRHQRQSSAATFVNTSIERSKHTAVLSHERVGQPAGQVGRYEGSSSIGIAQIIAAATYLASHCLGDL